MGRPSLGGEGAVGRNGSPRVTSGAGERGGSLGRRRHRRPDPPPDPVPGPVGSPAGPPGPPERVVVWLGDSTAAGVGASGPRAALPWVVADRLGRPVRLTVLARSGARIADVVRLQLPGVARLAPDVVFVSVGANDATHLTSRSKFRTGYAGLLAGLPAGVAQVVLLGVPDLGASTRLPEPLRALAGARGRALDRDVRQLLTACPGWSDRRRYVDLAGRTGPSFRRDPDRYLAADRFHPGDAGYRLWAEAVAATVAPGAEGWVVPSP